MGTEDGNNRPAWMEQLADDLKGNETLTQFETLSDLGTAFIDRDGKLQNSIQLLGEDATDEERATFFNSLGRPESPDGYELQRPELPEGMPYDEAGEEKFREVLHNLGLTKAQGEELFRAYQENNIETYSNLVEQRKTHHNEQVEALRQEWGDAYQENAEKAIRVAEKLGGEEFTNFLELSGLGDNPLIVKFCHAVHDLIGEDTLLTGGKTGGGDKADAASVLYPEMGEGD